MTGWLGRSGECVFYIDPFTADIFLSSMLQLRGPKGLNVGNCRDRVCARERILGPREPVLPISCSAYQPSDKGVCINKFLTYKWE